MNNGGHVAIVGAGPGDPGLLTFAAAHALAEADVVLYDALVAPEILVHARKAAELRYTGKRAGEHALSQSKMQTLMVELAREGKRVVRLKGGDPFAFGRGSEEAEACREAGIPYTVVPGIPSAIAGPAYAGIPVTHRGLSGDFLVMTGHRSEGEPGPDWAFAAKAGTLVVLMGVEQLGTIVNGLVAAGKSPDTPVAAIRWGTRNDQLVVRGTLATIEDAAARAKLASPAVIVAGEVAALADTLSWFEPGPLAGRRIVVARARAQASDLARRLRELGAEVTELPTIQSRPVAAPSLADALVRRPDWIVLPSAASVAAVREGLDAAGFDARVLGSTKIAALGAPALDALAAWSLRADFVPSKATLSVLADELPVDRGRDVLVVAAVGANESALEPLRARGATVRLIPAYIEEPQPLHDQQRREIADAHAIVFSSASTVSNLANALGEDALPAAKLLSIGPQTSARLRDTFGRVDAEAAEPNAVALLDLLLGAEW